MYAKFASSFLFYYQRRNEVIEFNGSPLAELIDAYNVEKYWSSIFDCFKRDMSKKVDYPSFIQKNQTLILP